MRVFGFNRSLRMLRWIFHIRKMSVNKRSRIAVVVPVVDVKKRRGNQCKKHCPHGHPRAESTHTQRFSSVAELEVNEKAVVLCTWTRATALEGQFEPYVKSSNTVRLSAFVHTPTFPASLNVSSSHSMAFLPSYVTTK